MSDAEARQPGKSPPFSVNWVVGSVDLEIINTTTGRRSCGGPSRLCKHVLSARWARLYGRVGRTHPWRETGPSQTLAPALSKPPGEATTWSAGSERQDTKPSAPQVSSSHCPGQQRFPGRLETPLPQAPPPDQPGAAEAGNELIAEPLTSPGTAPPASLRVSQEQLLGTFEVDTIPGLDIRKLTLRKNV